MRSYQDLIGSIAEERQVPEITQRLQLLSNLGANVSVARIGKEKLLLLLV
jgi:hypothetical protein